MIGHNIRPLDEVRERLEALAAAANEWAKLDEIADEATASRADGFLNQLVAEEKRLTATEGLEKEPHQIAINTIAAAYRPFREMLSAAKSLLQPKVAIWLKRKSAVLEAEKARQREVAEQAARELAAITRAAAQRPTVENRAAVEAATRKARQTALVAAQEIPRAQVRGEYSTRSRSLRRQWKAEVLDPLQAFVYFQDHADIIATLTKLASAAARAGSRDIPGCRIYAEETAV